MAKSIPLTRGHVALVDDTDYEWLNQWSWQAIPVKNSGLVYARRTASRCHGGGVIYMHRQILGLHKGDGLLADHADGNGLNNIRTNLRVATALDNSRNQKNKSSRVCKYRGVIKPKLGPHYHAQIKVDSELVFLGAYRDERNAALAYDQAAREHFGEFAVLNFPNELIPTPKERVTHRSVRSISEESMAALREERIRTGMSYEKLGKKHDVSTQTAWNVVNKF